MQRTHFSLQMVWARMDQFQRGLLALMILRWVVAAVFILDLLPLDLRDPTFRFYLHHGGDQGHFMALAESILNGSPMPTRVGLGQALVMLPWIALIQPYSYFEIVAPLVIINGFLLAGLSVIIVGVIAQRTTRSKLVGLASAGFWAILPLLSYFSFFWHFNPVNVQSSTVPLLGWLNGLSDGPALFLFLCALMFLSMARDSESAVSFKRMLGVGLLLGLMITFRIHYVPAVAFIGLYVLVAHGIQAALTVAGGAFLAYIPEAWYNQLVFGLPLTTGYISDQDLGHWGGTLSRPLSDLLASLPFNLANIDILFTYYLGRRPWLLFPLLGILVTVAVMTIVVWRRQGWQALALLLGAPLAYLIPMSFTWPFRDAVMRFAMPTFPNLLIVSVYMALIVFIPSAVDTLPRQPASRSLPASKTPVP